VDNSKAHDEYQSMGALLALNGMAAFVFDPIDQGERIQALDKGGNPLISGGVTGHLMLGVGSILLGRNTAWFEIYDGMRAIDYLQSRSEIDPERIGCTGNSGGGTQTSYLMALDDRIKAAAVSCYLHRLSRQVEISFGDAEQNIHGQLAFGMEHADYMMMRAPMPLLICAATKDFFDINAVWGSFRYAKRLYTRLGVPEKIDLIENDAGHNYNQQQRQAIAHWMARWLCDRDESITEPDIELISKQQLQCTPKGKVMLIEGAKSAYDINADYEKELAVQCQRSWAKGDKKELLEQVRGLAGIRKLDQIPTPEIEHAGTVKHLSYEVEKLVIKPEDDIYLPALLFKPKGDKITQAAVYLHQDGKETDAYAGGPIEQLLKKGKIVLAVDVRGSGETQAKVENYFVPSHLSDDWMDIFSAYLLDQSYVGMRAEDVLVCARLAAGYTPNGGKTAVNLVAVGNIGVPALHAAALEADLFKSVTLKKTLVSWSDVVNTPVSERQLINTVHGALRVYDLPNLVDILGDKLTIIEPVNAKNLPF
jgi:dienelactone hydrolase